MRFRRIPKNNSSKMHGKTYGAAIKWNVLDIDSEAK